MFRELKKKIIVIQIAAFLVVTIAIVGTINLNTYRQMIYSAHQVLTMLADGSFPVLHDSSQTEQNDGAQEEMDSTQSGEETDSDRMSSMNNDFDFGFGAKMTEETSYITRYFYVQIGADGEIAAYNLDHIASVSDRQVEEYAVRALEKRGAEGMLDHYRYLRTVEGEDTMIYFIDCYTQQNYVWYILRLSLLIAFLCMIFVCIFVYLLSDKAIAPLEENLKKQRRFITDASHELKTPLAAISANTDVLELMVGENEITEKIKHQTKQLNGLVNEMLTLSKMDGTKVRKEEDEVIDLSALLQSSVSDFLAVAASRSEKLTAECGVGIRINGIRKDITRLVSVLMDNAVKYCTEDGEILVRLTAAGKAAHLEIHNSCEPIPETNLNRLFERFYRTDTSRSRDTGSYGIGLSIAKAIVLKHNGRISAKNESGGVCFCVELPLKKKYAVKKNVKGTNTENPA